MSTTYPGIDYGHGKANVDPATGIRYGVIAQQSIDPEAFDDIWMQTRDLTYEAAVAEAKQRIAAITCQEDLAGIIDDIARLRDDRQYEELMAYLKNAPQPLSAEDAEQI